MSSELKQKTISALFWNFIEKFGQQLLYLLTGMIVARIVTSEEYGQVGILAIFIALSTILSESGFSASLIRKKELGDADCSTVFLFNLGVSIFLYLLLFFGAPFIADFYNQPELTRIARVLFVSILFYAGGLIQQVQMTRKLEFKLLSKINLSALLIASVVSVVLAVTGFGVWALVFQTVGLAFLRCLFLWIFGAWKLSLRFDFGVIRSFFGFSSRLILVSILNAVANNFYGLLIGKVYLTSDVGNYNQAYKYQDIPAGIVTNSFRAVLLPVVARVTQDPERTKNVLRRIVGTIALIIFPAMALLIIIGKPLIVALISAKWLPAVPIFQVLCVSGAFMPFALLLGDSFTAMGRSSLTLRYEAFRKVLLFAGIFFIYERGILALAWLWVGYMVLSVGLALYFMRFILHYGFAEFINDIWRYLVLAAVLAGGLYYTTPFFNNMFIQLGVQCISMGVLYVGILLLTGDEALREGLGLIRGKIKR